MTDGVAIVVDVVEELVEVDVLEVVDVVVDGGTVVDVVVGGTVELVEDVVVMVAVVMVTDEVAGVARLPAMPRMSCGVTSTRAARALWSLKPGRLKIRIAVVIAAAGFHALPNVPRSAIL